MTYSMLLLAEVCMKNIVPALFWNFDATQFVVRGVGANAKVYLLRGFDPAIPVTKAVDEPLAFAIKLLLLVSSDGKAAPLNFTIAFDDMLPNTYEIYEIVGLTSTTDRTKVDYLIFAHNRAGTSDFYRCFFRDVVITNVVADRAAHDLRDENGMFQEITVTCDGETTVLNEVFTDEIVSDLNDHEVVVCKLPASCSAIHQALDVGPIFKGAKSRLEKIVRTEQEVSNPMLSSKIASNLKHSEGKYDIILTSDTKKNMIRGVGGIVRAAEATHDTKWIHHFWSVPL